MKKFTFYNFLDNDHKDLVDKIDNHEILGASQHLNIISDLFINIVVSNKNLPVNELINLINNTKEYYMETRGNSSRAVVNGILKLLQNVNHSIDNKDYLVSLLINNQNSFIEESIKNLEKIVEYSINELSNFSSILLYDYSSTVEKAITAVLENNPQKKYIIYISESSAIDGGSPYLKLNSFENSKVTFFPDSALAYYLLRIECCLMGAETFYSDGTGFNTIGSDLVSLICEKYNVPLYFITPMNKLDNRRIKGIKKGLVTTDYREKYKYPNKIESDIDTVIPELIGVDSKNIYAYITEDGVVPSDQLFYYSIKYLNNIKGGKK